MRDDECTEYTRYTTRLQKKTPSDEHTTTFRSAYSSIENGAGSNDGASATASDSLSGSSSSKRMLEPGEVAGDYSRDWKGERRHNHAVVDAVDLRPLAFCNPCRDEIVYK